MMSLIGPRKKKPRSVEPEYEIRPDQKLCRRCNSVIAHELVRCPFCGNAPWKWHPNARLLIITLLIALFMFILFPLLTSREKPYRVPVTEDEAAP